MAKKSESIEGNYAIWGCLDCGHNHYIRKDSYTQDGLRCEECHGLVKVVGFTNQKPSPLKGVPNKTNPLTVKVNIDVSEALKGLKALQREAKKTARVLKDVEEQRRSNPIFNITMNSGDDPIKIVETVKIQLEKLSNNY